MPDNPRDKYVPKHPTPPGGVKKPTDNRQPISKPVEAPESWEDDDAYTPVTPVTRPAMARTISDDLLDTVARRTGEAKNAAIDMKRAAMHAKETATTTLDRVELLRKETSQKIDKIDTKVNDVIKVVGDMREEVGRQGGQNTLIISMIEDLQDSRSRTEHVITTTRLAEVEVDKSRMLTDVEVNRQKALAQIEEDKADKALKRELTKQLVIKVLAAIGVVWAAISTYYLAK